MTKKRTQVIPTLVLLGIGAILVAVLFIQGKKALGNVSQDSPRGGLSGYQNYTFFASSTSQIIYATTTTATSTNITPWVDASGRIDNGYFVVAGAKRVQFYFTRGDKLGGGNTGNTVFKVQVSPDGSNWYDYNSLFANSSTTLTSSSAATVTVSAATSTVLTALDLAKFTPYAVRCIVVETTDGSHECSASADW